METILRGQDTEILVIHKQVEQYRVYRRCVLSELENPAQGAGEKCLSKIV